MNVNCTSTRPQQQAGTKTVATPVAGPQIHEEIALLIDSNAALSSTLDVLAARLGPVLHTLGPDAAACESLDAYRVPMADTIRGERRRVQMATERVQDLINRLEL